MKIERWARRVDINEVTMPFLQADFLIMEDPDADTIAAALNVWVSPETGAKALLSEDDPHSVAYVFGGLDGPVGTVMEDKQRVLFDQAKLEISARGDKVLFRFVSDRVSFESV